ncbi:6016_t:CDS:2, partial [Ambispora leptoticha]
LDEDEREKLKELTEEKKRLEESKQRWSDQVMVLQERLTTQTDRPEIILSFEDVMKTITSNFKHLKRSSKIATEDIPLQGRDFANDLKIIKKNVTNSEWKSGTVAKTDYRILVAGGTAGIGKTRYGRELFKKLEQDVNLQESIEKPISFVYLLLDFSNGLKLNEDDSELSIQILVGLRIAYAFFIWNNYDVEFTIFRQTVRLLKLTSRFNSSTVIAGIHKHLNLSVDRLLFLFLHIDEFQTIFEFSGWKADMRKDKNGKPKGIFKAMLYEVAQFMVGSNIYFVQPFLSGTAPQEVIRQKEPTMYSFEFVDCSLLNMQARINIMNHFATKSGFSEKTWNLQERMYFLLCDTGGLPRAIQCLLECCFGKKYERTDVFFENISSLDYSDIYNDVARGLDTMYGIKQWVFENKELVEVIIDRCLAIIPSRRPDLLSPNRSDTLESLERDQHLVLTDYSIDGRVLITVPPIFINIYIRALSPPTSTLKMSFLPGWAMEWKGFEIFVAEYVAFRISALFRLGHKTVALKNIFRGAYGSSTLLNKKVELRNTTVKQLRNKFPMTASATDKQFENVDIKSGMIVNGDKASFADSFIVFEKSKLIVGIQNKLRKGSFEVSDMQKEHDKNVTAIKEAPPEFDINDYTVITVFILSANFKGDIAGYCKKPLQDCLMICRHNFEDFFGHVFSCRIALQIARERNPNFTPPDHWLTVSTKIPDSIVNQVSKKRPFYSPQDLYDLDPWFKTYEKDINDMSYTLYTEVTDVAKAKKRRLEYYFYSYDDYYD